METNGQILRKHADRMGLPSRTLEQVQTDLANAAKRDPETAQAMARLMLRHGRLTLEARRYLQDRYSCAS